MIFFLSFEYFSNGFSNYNIIPEQFNALKLFKSKMLSNENRKERNVQVTRDRDVRSCNVSNQKKRRKKKATTLNLV